MQLTRPRAGAHGVPLKILLAVALTGCAAERPEREPAHAPEAASPDADEELDPVAEGVLAADWPGRALGLPAPTVVSSGQAEIVTGSEALAEPAPAAMSAREPFAHLPETELDAIDLATGRRYRVSMPEELDALTELRAREDAERGALEEGERESALGSAAVEKRITGGQDTRARLGLEDGQPETGWLAAIGLLDPEGCTGTLISRSAYITAAHCLYTKAGKIVKRDLFPRADGSGGFYLPWGIWDATFAAAPAAFAQNKCYEADEDDRNPACDQYDVALVKVTPDSGYPPHKWWFGIAAESRATLLTRELKNRGYPLCSAVDAPAGCASGASMTLYGDRGKCTLGDDVYPNDPYSPVVYHGCDTSRGHSGSALFYYQSGSAPVIIGVHVGSLEVGGVWRNRFKRFSPNTLRWINGLL